MSRVNEDVTGQLRESIVRRSIKLEFSVRLLPVALPVLPLFTAFTAKTHSRCSIESAEQGENVCLNKPITFALSRYRPISTASRCFT